MGFKDWFPSMKKSSKDRPDQPEALEPAEIKGKKITTVKPDTAISKLSETAGGIMPGDLHDLYAAGRGGKTAMLEALAKEKYNIDYNIDYQKIDNTFEQYHKFEDEYIERRDMLGNVERVLINSPAGQQELAQSLRELVKKTKKPPPEPGVLPVNPYCSPVGEVTPGEARQCESIDYLAVFGADAVYDLMECEELTILLVVDNYEKTPLQFWKKSDREGKRPGKAVSKRLVYVGLAATREEAKERQEQGKITFLPMFRASLASIGDKASSHRGLVNLVKNIAAPLTFAGREVLVPIATGGDGPDRTRQWKVFSPTIDDYNFFILDVNLLEGDDALEAINTIASNEIDEQIAWYERCRAQEQHYLEVEHIDGMSFEEVVKRLGPYDELTRTFSNGLTDADLLDFMKNSNIRPPGHPVPGMTNPCNEIPLGSWDDAQEEMLKQKRRSALLNIPVVTATQKQKDVDVGAFMMKNQ